VDDGFLMRMLHAFAGLNEEIEPLVDRELLLIATLCNRQSRHVFHHEIRLPLRIGPGVEHLGDGGMVHDRQRLALGLEALHNGFVVHTGFDQLQSDLTPHGRDLIGQPDLPHAAFTKLAEDLKTLRE
jgi:hypothetical protein